MQQWDGISEAWPKRNRTWRKETDYGRRKASCMIHGGLTAVSAASGQASEVHRPHRRGKMCPMCEKRAQLLLQQQAIVEPSGTSSKPSGTDSNLPGKRFLFRNPFKACKHLTHRCCSPHCESQRTSVASGRRSSAIAPVPSTPEHSSELTYIVSESPLSANSKDPEPQEAAPGKWPRSRKSRRRKGLLTRLKALTQAPGPKVHNDEEPSSTESSFAACGRKVKAVADELGEPVKAPTVMPSVATLLAAETDLDDSMSEVSIAVTDTNVSETTDLSMMNLNGSIYSPYEMTASNRGSNLKSSAYDDDASSFAIVPRTSMNSSYAGRFGPSDASGLSDRFGELDIGYLSLEESGEVQESDVTVSISSDQSEHLDLEMHSAQDDTVSESDLDQEYSVGTDSQEWFTETEDAASVLQRSRTHHNRGGSSSSNTTTTTTTTNKQFHGLDTQPPLPHPPSGQENQVSPAPTTKTNIGSVAVNQKPLSAKKDTTPLRDGHRLEREATRTPPPALAMAGTEYLCSRCGRREAGHQTKSLTTKMNPMSSFFKTYMGEEEQAVMAAKVVVLLGKYGNRKGLRVSGLSTPQQQQHHHQGVLSTRELERLRSMVCPSDDAVSAFQSEVATMMLEGVDVPELNMDVEQFIAGYMKLNSPFYVDLIQDFFKSVCIDCFGTADTVPGARRRTLPPRPAYAVLKPRKPKTIAAAGQGNSTRRLLH